MPTYGIALYWDLPEHAAKAKGLVESLAETYPREQVARLEVIRRLGSVVLYLELDFSLYGRATLNDVERRTIAAGGKMVELMRLAEAEREQFKAKFLKSALGPGVTFDAYSEAAKMLVEHLGSLRQGQQPQQAPASAPVTASAPAPATASAPAPPSGPRPAQRPAPASPAKPPVLVRQGGTGAADRKDPRVDVTMEIEFKTDSAFVTEYASNLSKGGVFVRTKLRPQQNTYVPLRLHLPSGKILETSARVVHVFDHPEHGGVGLAFEKRDPQFEKELVQYIAGLSADKGA
ncbi:MAG: PilZ domain-containing protein [Deltaproteobacteria bacterium]|nr:PilZ domain-containing protein [Deltaproteobacteria bacterium]